MGGGGLLALGLALLAGGAGLGGGAVGGRFGGLGLGEAGGIGAGGGEALALAFKAGALLAEPGKALAGAGALGLERAGAGGARGGFVGGFVRGFFGVGRLRRSGGEGGGDGGSAVGLGGGGCGEVFAFGGEAGERGLGVGGEGGGVGEIALELGKTRLGGGESGAGARGLGLDLLAGEPRALERGALGGFGVPLGGQEGGEAGGAGACGGGLAGRLGERGAGGVKLGKGGFVGGEGARLLDRQEVRLRGTDRAAEIAVAARLARLALEAGELLLEPGLELVGAGEVGLGRLELELGLVAAGVQAGDAGGLLEQRAALLGPGGDEGGDAALAHHGRGARAAAEIGKQGLDVARAGLLAVDAEGRCRGRARRRG